MDTFHGVTIGMLIYILGERHSGTNLLRFCIESFYPKHVQPPIDRLPFKEADGNGYHSKHMFKPIMNKCDATNLYVHITRDPCSWSHAMFKKPRAGYAKDARTLDRFLSSEWVESVTGTVWPNILHMRRHRMRRIDSFLNTCVHTERVGFDEFARDPLSRMQSWHQTYNLSTSERVCKVSRMLPYVFPLAARRRVENVTHETCDDCCWTPVRKTMENYMQTVRS